MTSTWHVLDKSPILYLVKMQRDRFIAAHLTQEGSGSTEECPVCR